MASQLEIWFVGGTGKASADAVALRWGNDLESTEPDQTVAVIDSGRSTADREELVRIVRERFTSETIDHLVATHSDNDHIGQMSKLKDDFDIGQVWAHNPWKHLHVYPDYPRKVEASAQDQRKLLEAYDVTEPLPGLGSADGVMRFLGPSVTFYEELLPKIFTLDQLLDNDPSTIAASAALTREPKVPLDAGFAIPGIEADWETDHLGPGNNSSASNKASVITSIQIGNSYVLLSGDSDAQSFDRATDEITATGITPSTLRIVQIPHHGSWRNMNKNIADLLCGQPPGETKAVEQLQSAQFRAVAMTGTNDDDHPSERVLNAFIRRGRHAVATKGQAVGITLGIDSGKGTDNTDGVTLIPFPRN